MYLGSLSLYLDFTQSSNPLKSGSAIVWYESIGVTIQTIFKHSIVKVLSSNISNTLTTLDGEMMWTNGDFKLSNIAVINKDNQLSYKVLDPDSWEILPGYSSVEAYYQCQFQLAFMTQTLINRIFYNG